MSLNNSILCKVCNGIDFEPANGAFYCQSCGTESREHGQDFVYEETCLQYAEPSEVFEYSDSNDENHWKNDYPDQNMLQSVIEESTDDENELIITLENLEKSHFTSDTKQQMLDLETDEESQEQVGSWNSELLM